MLVSEKTNQLNVQSGLNLAQLSKVKSSIQKFPGPLGIQSSGSETLHLLLFLSLRWWAYGKEGHFSLMWVLGVFWKVARVVWGGILLHCVFCWPQRLISDAGDQRLGEAKKVYCKETQEGRGRE